MRYPAHFVLHAGLPNKYFAVSPKCHRQRSIYHDCVWVRRYRAATNALQYKCPFQSASTCSVESALHSIRPCTLHSIQKSSTSTSTLPRKFFHPLFSSTIYILHGLLIRLPWRQPIYNSTRRRNSLLLPGDFCPLSHHVSSHYMMSN